MKTRGYSIRARGIERLIDRPDIWEQLCSPTTPLEATRCLQSGRSPYMCRRKEAHQSRDILDRCASFLVGLAASLSRASLGLAAVNPSWHLFLFDWVSPRGVGRSSVFWPEKTRFASTEKPAALSSRTRLNFQLLLASKERKEKEPSL